jgi:tripartite-type tricarboxylate transporter receptor subunit TctC
MAGLILLGHGASTRAQEYPNRVVTIIVPFAPGGPSDILARQLAASFQAKFGQTYVVENVSGAATTIGTGRVARAVPDGYTLLINNLAISANPALFPKLPFDPATDLVTVGFVNHSALVMIGRKSIPANTLSELTAWMRGTRAKVAHTGAGSTAHLAATIIGQIVGAEIDQIPYRGGAPALQDVVAGHVDLFFGSAQAHIAPIREGIVKGFGVTASKRMEALPDVPALGSELDKKLEIWFWHGLFAPAGTPTPVVDKLNAALQEFLDDPKTIRAWDEIAVYAYPKEQRSPEAGHALLRSEIARWAGVFRDNKIEPVQP